MKTKYLLTGLVLPALFAACTAEDVVAPQQSDINVNDLAERPVVGELTLSMEDDAQTRAEIKENTWSDIEFSGENGDAIGARIIDSYDSDADNVKDYEKKRVAWAAYSITDGYASSNYQFNYADGKWKTNALMVEGHYMFYFPYNEKNVSRKPIEFVLPKTQTVKPNVSGGEKNAIADLYAGDEPAFVGYKFIAAGDGLEQKVNMQPVFAYPLFTIINDYTFNDEDGKTVYEDVTIDSVVFISDAFDFNFGADHTGVQTHLTGDMKYSVYKNDKKPSEGLKDGPFSIYAGNWASNKTFLGTPADASLCADIAEIAKYEPANGKVSVVFDGGKKLTKNGGTWSFYAVLPAVKYTELTAQVYVNGGDMFEEDITIANDVNSKVLTFAPGKRYPREEYNIEAGKVPSVKTSAGSLATIRLSKGGKIVPAEEIYFDEPIENLEDFEELLKEIDQRDRPLVEVRELKDIKNVDDDGNKVRHFVLAKATDENGEELDYAALTVNKAFYEKLAIYSDANVTFCSKMQVVGGSKEAERLNAAGETFNGGVVASGFATLGNITGNLNVSAGNIIAGNVSGTGAGVVNVTGGVLSVGSSNSLTVSGGKVTVTADNTGRVLVSGGEATVKKATELKVTNGTLTVNAKNDNGATVEGGTLNANKKLGAIKVKGGTANINVQYLSADDNTNTVTVNGGTVVFGGGKADQIIKNNGRGNWLNISAGTVKVGENTELLLSSTTPIAVAKDKTITLENNGTLSSGMMEILKDVTLNNNGKWNVGTAENNGTIENKGEIAGENLTNNATINNWSDRVVLAKNNGTVYMKDHAAELTVNGGTGTIDNQEKAHLIIASAAKQTVVYTLSDKVSNATLEGLDTKKYLINKVVFNNAQITLDEAFETTGAGLSDVLYGVTTLDFNGGSLFIEDNIKVNIATVNIKGNVEFKGWGDGLYTLEDAVTGTINLAVNSKLTINDMTLKNVQFVQTQMTEDEKKNENNKLGTWTTVGEGKALSATSTTITAGTVVTPAP